MKFRLHLPLALGWALLSSQPAHAEQFDSVSVLGQTLTSGDTHHGYREMRIFLENRSTRDTFKVRLEFPDSSAAFGPFIIRMRREVTLGAGSRAVVPLWQPPVANFGSGDLRVYVNGEDVGTMSLPRNPHLSGSSHRYGGFPAPASVLASQQVGYDELSRALQTDKSAFSPGSAVGPPDAPAAPGASPAGWTPEAMAANPHWLEVDFDPPRPVSQIRVWEKTSSHVGFTITATGSSGSNLPPVLIPPPPPGSRRVPRDVFIPETPEPVKMLRLDFGSAHAHQINIDAVEAGTPGNMGFASGARGSSTAGVTSPPPYFTGTARVDGKQVLRAELPVSEWSEAWLSYTPFDGIAVTGNEMRTMPPAVQSALLQYAECGGTLLVLGESTVPEGWRHFPSREHPGGRMHLPGFGSALFLRDPSASQAGAELIEDVSKRISAGARRWESPLNEASANAAFPVAPNLRLPARGLVLLMFGFVLLIGPVNIVVLSRMKRRTWLLWTIPVISGLTTLMVFAYSFMREGFTPDVRIAGLTHLDQANHRASTFGLTAFYCPLTPAQGLLFSPETEATPLVEVRDYRRTSVREVDWTRGQHLVRGWISARVPSHFMLRKSETRRERIQLERQGTQLQALNGLGAPVKRLILCDSSGALLEATGIPPGGKTALATSGKRSSADAPLRELSDALNVNTLGSPASPGLISLLRPNTYLAELEGNPFIENGLGAKSAGSRTAAHALVYGVLEPEPETAAHP